jgi:antitoxin component YwqK of YwqJK toxin-antitoxin module
MKHIKVLILSLVISLLSLPSWAETDEKYIGVNSDGLIVWKFNGKPFTGTLKDSSTGTNGRVEKGIKEGYWEVGFDDGKIHSKGNYKGGKVDGYWEFYYQSGGLENYSNLIEGKKEGLSVYYKEDGSLQGSILYKNDLAIEILDNGIIEDEEIGNKEITVPDFTKEKITVPDF